MYLEGASHTRSKIKPMQLYKNPTEDLVRKEIETLMEEYKKFDLSEYIDLYEGKTHALFKYNYSFDRYLFQINHFIGYQITNFLSIICFVKCYSIFEFSCFRI